MSTTRNELPESWIRGKLGDYISLANGKSVTKKEIGEDKLYPAYGSSSILGRVDKFLITEDTICIGRVGACGVIQVAKAPCWISDNAMYVNQHSQSINFDFLKYLLFFLKLERLSSRTSQPSIPQGVILEQEILLPPLLVQERIVQILRKADEIRHKRQDAVAITENILPSIFHEMFSSRSNEFPTRRLRELCKLTYGGTPSKRNLAFWTNGTIPWVSPKDMKVPEIKDAPDKVTEEALGSYPVVKPGTVLVVVRGMILHHSVPVCLVQTPLMFNQDIKGLVPHEDIPGEYLFWALRSVENRLLELVDTASHGTKRIDVNRLLDLHLFDADFKGMKYFASIHRHFFDSQAKRQHAVLEAQEIFETMLSQAFTGELTAEWEAANVDLIAAKQRYSDRLPRLVLLSFLRDKIHRSQQADATVLVTALMKYLFLFQMEGAAQRRLYQFIPYHYGPFAKELYPDLEALQEEGLLTVDNGDETKTHLSLTNPEAVEQTLAALTHDLDPELANLLTEDFTAIQADITTILNTYGALDHNNLLTTVYEKYPAYAQRSKVKNRPRSAKSSNDTESQDNED